MWGSLFWKHLRNRSFLKNAARMVSKIYDVTKTNLPWSRKTMPRMCWNKCTCTFEKWIVAHECCNKSLKPQERTSVPNVHTWVSKYLRNLWTINPVARRKTMFQNMSTTIKKWFKTTDSQIGLTKWLYFWGGASRAPSVSQSAFWHWKGARNTENHTENDTEEPCEYKT